MAFFKFFHATKTLEEDIQREKDCILRIKNAVSQKCGIDKFVVKSVRAEILGGGENGEQRDDMCLPTILDENIAQIGRAHV